MWASREKKTQAIRGREGGPHVAEGCGPGLAESCDSHVTEHGLRFRAEQTSMKYGFVFAWPRA
jgi:hypothetical protein